MDLRFDRYHGYLFFIDLFFDIDNKPYLFSDIFTKTLNNRGK